MIVKIDHGRGNNGEADDVIKSMTSSTAERFSIFNSINLIVVSIICFSGEKLSICGGGRMTCCTPAMENKLSDISDKQFQAILQESTGSLLNNFTSRARKFDGRFHV